MVSLSVLARVFKLEELAHLTKVVFNLFYLLAAWLVISLSLPSTAHRCRWG